MTFRSARLVFLMALGLVVGSGCSASQSIISGPQHRLIPEAKAFRNLSPVTAPVPRELAKELLPAFVVEPGDVLLVQPVELDSPVRLPADQTVLPDGTIELGKFGRPVVAARTLPEIETIVQSAVNAGVKEPTPVTVRLVSRQSKVYYVVGEVNAPGSFPIHGRETVLDALMAAGGLTRHASESKIVLSRPSAPEGCRTVLPVCYPQIVQLGDTSTNYQLQPGDRIFVPSKGLMESLFPCCEPKCSPCTRPQVPCLIGGPGCAEATTAPVMNTVIPAASNPKPRDR